MTHEITLIDKKSIAMTCVNFSLLNSAVKFALKTVNLHGFALTHYRVFPNNSCLYHCTKL